MTDQEYAGRVAIITGGGRGFGKAFGHAIADRGGHAVLADIDLAAAEAAAKEIRDAGGGASAVRCDVAAEADVDRLIAEMVASYGGIDVLINNAGLHSAEYGQPMGVLGTEKVRQTLRREHYGRRPVYPRRSIGAGSPPRGLRLQHLVVGRLCVRRSLRCVEARRPGVDDGLRPRVRSRTGSE